MKILAKLTKPRVLAVLMIAACITSLLGRSFAGRLRQLVQPALAPLSDGAMYLTTLVRKEVQDLTAKGLSGAEAEALRQENREFRGRVVTLEAELSRQMRRQMAMDSLYGRELRGFPCKLIPARVVGEESLPYGQSRVVNVGTSDAVGPGAVVTTRHLLTDRSKILPPDLAVLTCTAMVGRLTATGPFTARLQLVTDKGFVRLARIQRVIDPRNPREITEYTGSGGVVRTLTDELNRKIRIDVQVQGDGKGGMIADDVKAYHNVRPGDWLVTNPDEAFIPDGIRIGTVEKVTEAKHPSFVKLLIKPQADLGSLREVYIVYPLGGSPSGPNRGGPR